MFSRMSSMKAPSFSSVIRALGLSSAATRSLATRVMSRSVFAAMMRSLRVGSERSATPSSMAW